VKFITLCFEVDARNASYALKTSSRHTEASSPQVVVSHVCPYILNTVILQPRPFHSDAQAADWLRYSILEEIELHEVVRKRGGIIQEELVLELLSPLDCD
jgi:hypothetical protein